MMIWTAPSVRTCFKNALLQREDSTSITLDAAKGEFVSMQILVRNNERLGGTRVEGNGGKVVHIRGGKVTQTSGEKFDVSDVRIQAQEYISFADGITYPDALSDNCVADVDISTTQSIWVTFPVSQNQPHGEYKFRVDIESDSKEEIFADVTLKVYNVKIPSPDKGEYSIEHFTTPEDQELLDCAGYDCKAYDEKWWEFMENYAVSLKECRSNVYRLKPVYALKAAGSKRISKDKWHFDFSLFDRMVDLLIKNNVVSRFAIDDVLECFDGHGIFALDENGEFIQFDISTPDAEAWAKEYFTALYEHISKHSTPDNWIMHIQDEPQNAETWLWARELVKKYMPGFICGNPTCQNIDAVLGDAVELYIPVFFVVEDEIEFYKKTVKNPDKEVWAYCCCGPSSSWYLNRFIDRPSVYGRLIAWATFSREFTGFLHYGYSYWQKNETLQPFGIDEHTQHKGDCMIIYPSPENNSYKISIRYINLRDGAQDYELLKIIEKADKEKAFELSRSVAEGYRDFNADEKHFLDARRKLLELAEKYSN